MAHGTWMVLNDQRLGLWVGLWGWDNRVVENQGRHILCRGCPPFAHPAVARAMGLEPGSLSLATHQRTHCQDRLPQSPRSRPLHHEQSCPAAASASADRSSRLLHFLPAPTDTLRPSPPIGKLPALPPGHTAQCRPNNKPWSWTRSSPSRGLSSARPMVCSSPLAPRPPPPPNSPPRWPRTDRDGAPQTQTTRTTRPSTRPTEATSSKGRRDL